MRYSALRSERAIVHADSLVFVVRLLSGCLRVSPYKTLDPAVRILSYTETGHLCNPLFQNNPRQMRTAGIHSVVYRRFRL